MLVSLNLIFVLFHPNVYYLNHPSVVDCLAGKLLTVLMNASVTKPNLCSFSIQMCTIHPSVVDCLGGKWTDCVTEC